MEKKEEEETGMKEDFYSTFRGELLLSVVKERGNRSHFFQTLSLSFRLINNLRAPWQQASPQSY